MARSGDFLARFRPVGTPGAAATAGVPADRIVELTAELGPVLDALADTLAQAAAIRASAAEEALRRRRDGHARAEAVVVAAGERAEAEQAETLTRARGQAEDTVSQAVRAARAEAAAIEKRVGERLPAMVDRVRAAVRAELFVDARPDGTDRSTGRR